MNLGMHGVQIFYDFRMNATSPQLLAPLQRENLRAGCARKGIQYKHVGLGPKFIGKDLVRTLLEHVQSDEGQHTLTELVWCAARKKAAFLGDGENWRDDPHRLAIATELVRHGHVVQHIASDGSPEAHEAKELPEWVKRREPKARSAGPTALRPEQQVSALSKPIEEVDVAAALRGARTQVELKEVQRKLVGRMQAAQRMEANGKPVPTFSHAPGFLYGEMEKREAKRAEKLIAESKTGDAEELKPAAQPAPRKELQSTKEKTAKAKGASAWAGKKDAPPKAKAVKSVAQPADVAV